MISFNSGWVAEQVLWPSSHGYVIDVTNGRLAAVSDYGYSDLNTGAACGVCCWSGITLGRDT